MDPRLRIPGRVAAFLDDRLSTSQLYVNDFAE